MIRRDFMNDDYDKYEETYDENLYTDGEDRKPKLVLIIIAIIILLVIVLIFFFSCSNKDTKSSNNYLSYISLSSGELSPTFEKDVLNYSVLATEDFMTISCNSESSKAITNGCNKRIYLTENCIEHIITVTAESKEIKEYKLNICKQSKETPIIKNVKVKPEGYSNEKVTVIVEATFVDGLNEKSYSFDGGVTWQSSNSFSVTENKTLEIKVRDKNNVESVLFIKEIKTIDKTKPSVVVKGSVGSGVSTTSDVVLTANVSPNTTPSGYKYQWYKGNESIKGATKNTYTATSAGEYKVKVITGSGNSATSNIFKVNKKQTGNTSYKIDIKVTKNTENWTKDNVILTIKATATNGLATDAYSFDGGKTFSKSNSKSFSSNQTVNIVVKDKKGNKATYKEYITKIDKSIPTVSINGNNTAGSKLTAKVTPSSTLSGYKYQWYYNSVAINGATSSTYTATKAGNYQIKVTTGSGNTKTSSVFTIKVNVPGSVSLNSSVATDTWTNKSVTLTARPTNGTVKKYKWYSGTTLLTTTTMNTYTINNNTNSTYKVIAEFTDGTTATSSSIVVKIDKTAPNVPTLKYNLNSYSGTIYTLGTWTNKNVYRQIKSNDTSSGIDHFEYKNVSSSASSCTGNKTGNEVLNNASNSINNNQNYQISYAPDSSNYACFRTVDKAGNVSEWTQVQRILIDKIVPYTPYITKNQPFSYNVACTVNNKETTLDAQTKDLRLCMGSTTDYNLNVEVKDEGGSGIAGCQYVLSESGSNGKNYGNIGNFKMDMNTGAFTGYDTINWKNGYGPGVVVNSNSISYLRRCYDRAGNYSNAIFIFWLIKN